MAVNTRRERNELSSKDLDNRSFDPEFDVYVTESVEYSPAGSGNASIKRKVTDQLALKIDDTTTASVTYLGKAAIGSAGSGAVWQIQRLDETSGLVITWADGDSDFDNIWDNRASLSYS